MTSEKTDHSVNPWPDLVMAILSVNNYPLTKVFTLFDALEANGLFDPHNFTCWNREEITRRLGAAGYDRGTVMTTILTDRLSSLGRLAENFAANERTLTKGTKTEIAELLRRVKGVGPKVLKNFFLLRGDDNIPNAD
jgi:hypothetical protein